jgi:hypothetical protein
MVKVGIWDAEGSNQHGFFKIVWTYELVSRRNASHEQVLWAVLRRLTGDL